MTGPRVPHLTVPIALAALLVLPAASSPASTSTDGGSANGQPAAVHLPPAICHQYCYGADQQLAADPGRTRHAHVIAIPSSSVFDVQDAAVGAAAGSGATLIALALLTRIRRSSPNS